MYNTSTAFQRVMLALDGAGILIEHPFGPMVHASVEIRHTVAVFDAAAPWTIPFREVMAQHWRECKNGICDAIVVGDRQAFETACETRPRFTIVTRLGVVWVSPDGAVDHDRASGTMLKAVREGLRTLSTTTPTDDVLARQLGEMVQRNRARLAEVAAFQQNAQRTPSWVTQALLVVIVLLFLAKLAVGEHGVATDVRMGAVVPARIGTEPWRLLSYAFLHAGFGHIAFNAMSLLSLGSFYEALLGRWRFALLFVLAAAGGGIAVSVRGADTVMVGASGGIWGLLGASLALGLRPGNLLPVALQKPFRQNAFMNLASQVGVSMLPGISALGHLGGGLVGFTLMLTPLLRPTSEQPKEHGLRFAGIVACVTALVCVVVANVRGAPWLLRAPPALHPYTLDAARVMLELPTAPRVVVGAIPLEYSVGNALDEGFVLALQVKPLQAPVGIDELPTLAEQIRTSTPTLGHPDGSREDGPVRIERRGAAIVLAQDFTNANDTRFEHRLAVRPHAVVSVQVVRRRDDTRSANLAMRVAESVHDVPAHSAP